MSSSNIPEVELAWAAGLFDGEGCVQIVKNNKSGRSFRVDVSICNTYLPALERISNIFGGGWKTRTHKYNETKPCYSWRCTGNLACNFIRAIRPYTTIKSDQIDVALELDERIKGFKAQSYRAIGETRNTGLPEDEIKYRLSLREKIMELKRG